ncbi:phospholipase effector Tle1 domain-containing protein [Luteimonas sp. A277]
MSLYGDDRHPDDDGPARFRRDCSVTGDETIPIQFIGVWDTVGALGIPVRGLRSLTAHKYRFHDVELSGSVRNAAHALAIDERRAPFEAARWAFKPKPVRCAPIRSACCTTPRPGCTA